MKKHAPWILIFCLAAMLAVTGCATKQGSPGDAAPPEEGPDKYLTVDGVRFHYTEYPASGEVVFLQHGFGSSTYTWNDVAPILQANGFHVIALDMMGFGYSDKPKGVKYDPVSLSEGVNAFMEAKGLSQVNFAGNSLGGGIGLLLAANHPDKIKKLVLVDSASPYEFKKPFIIKLASMPGATVMSSAIKSKALVRDNLEEVFYDKKGVTDERVNEYYARVNTPNGMYAQTMVARAARMDIYAEPVAKIAKTDLPVLIIWGENDQWIPVENGKKLHQDLPGSKIAFIPQCGHVPEEEKPRPTARLITSFLRDQPLKQ